MLLEISLNNPVLPWLLVDLAEPRDDVIGCHIIFLAGSSLACGEVCVCMCVCHYRHHGRCRGRRHGRHHGHGRHHVRQQKQKS